MFKSCALCAITEESATTVGYPGPISSRCRVLVVSVRRRLHGYLGRWMDYFSAKSSDLHMFMASACAVLVEGCRGEPRGERDSECTFKFEILKSRGGVLDKIVSAHGFISLFCLIFQFSSVNLFTISVVHNN